MARTINQTLTIMRRVIGRRNANDPDSTAQVLLEYLNDFIELTMSDDIRMFEQWGTLIFTIDENGANGVNNGVYTFNDVGAEFDFVGITMEGFISLLDPENNSTSWVPLDIYLDPGSFYLEWGINNYEILVEGFPTQMLFYGNEFVFRTIPNDAYLVHLYAYKKQGPMPDDPAEGNQNIPFDYWMRYWAYGAALNYARDFRYEQASIANIQQGFNREKKLMLTHAHNQYKIGRCLPRF